MTMTTDHMTRRQRKALRLQGYVAQRLARQERDWRKIAQWLSEFDAEQLYEEMDFTGLPEWAESVGISRSMAYDLIEIHRSPYRESLQGLGIAKARLVLPALKRADKQGAAEELLDSVAELTWHDTRQALWGDDPIQRVVVVSCPACGKQLRASKSVTLEVGH